MSRENGKVSRRSFVQGAGVLGAATAGSMTLLSQVGTVSAQDAPAWDREAEIVVVGYGNSGAVAAICAADAGADVLIIEKQQQDDGGEVWLHTPCGRLSFTAIMNFNDKQSCIDYYTASSTVSGQLRTDPEVIEAYSDYADTVIDFIESIGGEPVDRGSSMTEYSLDVFPQGDTYELWMFKGQGAEQWEVLDNAVNERAIPVLWETPAQHLVTDADGVVVGVEASQGETTVRIRATKAVILATGGFEGNAEMRNTYAFPPRSVCYGSADNTGDGIRMAQELGCDLVHMAALEGRPVPYLEEYGFAIQGGTANPFLLVDKYGRRFMNETWVSHTAVYEQIHFSTELCDFCAIPCFSIMDSTSLANGPIAKGGTLYSNIYVWSQDNMAEVEKGWIIQADTIEELAEKIAAEPEVGNRMDPAVLAATIAQYNQYAADGVDPDFGRPAAGLQPVATPPFYAMKLLPGSASTSGGPRRNGKCQVMHVNGNPIPHLYSCGEMGSILGGIATGGGIHVSEAYITGQIAAKWAVAEEPVA